MYIASILWVTKNPPKIFIAAKAIAKNPKILEVLKTFSESPDNPAMIAPTMTGLPSTYTPGLTYALSWTGSGMSSTGEGGFNLDASSGSWTNLGSRVKMSNGELTHSSDLQRSWSADWIAPSPGSGTVTFDLAVLYANGANGNSGDNWGTNSWTVSEELPPQNIPPVASDLRLTPNGDVAVDQSFTLSYLSLIHI